MATFFRKFLPTNPSASNSNFNADDEYNMEYSFALQYSGPPVTYDIPRVVPVDVGHIPTAAEVSTSSSLSNLSLPVVQPIVKKRKDHLSMRLPNERKLDLSAAANSPISVIDAGGFDDGREARLSSGQGTSFRVVNVIDDSGESGYSDSYEFITRRVLNRNASSRSLGVSESHGNSHELSENMDVEGVSDGPVGGLSSEFDKPGLRSPILSSEITSCEEEESVHEARSPRHRIPIVKFRDPELSDIVYGENDHVESVVVQEKQRSTRASVGKGLCHLCLKGNQFTQKEACLVCSAKYCYKCVLRAMGSMPEGRKCISCIGYRIDESKRATLGKSSRMIKRLHVKARAKEIMRHEISCKANQFPPELIYVNGRSLSEAELVELLCCPNPPRKLEPIKYWYDKVSGLWGKEGKKPCQIISAQLSVGDQIMRNASNGNTNILVNNREITRSELWMLEFAGINCEGKPHFWMSADGSFQEEGQKNVMKQKLFKPRIKLLCAILSLPVPSEAAHSGIQEDNKITSKLASGNLEQRKPCKFLMVGSEKSGTSTLFKQAKILYNAPFSEEERQEIKIIIQSKLYSYIGILLEDRERFEEESLNRARMKHADQLGASPTDQIAEESIYSINKRLRAFSDWLLQVMVSGNLEAIFPASTREYAPLVEELWKDKAIQATYNRINELQMLSQGVSYFLNRAVEITRADYEPSDIDILHAEGITLSNGIASVEFSFPKSVQDSYMDITDHDDPLKRYQLIRVHTSSLGNKCKWLEMFEEVDLVIYCVSLTDYCQFSYDTNGDATNNMLKSRNLFETIVNHAISSEKDCLLILTKFDLLEEMIEKVPLTRCEWFHDFNPVISSNPNSNMSNNSNASLAQRAFHYIASKFKGEFYSLTGNRLYVSQVSGLEADSVDEALKYAREILNWDFEKPTYNINEWSSGSVEISSSS
ncbi:hypothetical protein DCAR_0624083 [Daucus carota subsp. sativus]|uniref:Extra-large guanine nucleotide-binding protein 1-like n=1 Tax=Daucus carota subsp. sativus TaxID=79200 RepID=A0AAF1B5E4_DAUCS|nr:hypothetical protein DCAR_0624083 [Daucus carota subsp. sativus]